MRDQPTSTIDTTCGTGECRDGARNRFFRGKHMRAEDFTRDHDYFIGRRRLISRAVLGWGVVSGFRLTTVRPISVEPGFALDRHGREIVLTDTVAPGGTNTFLIEDHGNGYVARRLDTIDPPKAGEPPRRYVLAIHYAERRFGDVAPDDDCGCDDPQKNYVCETAVFTLHAISDRRCPCAEGPCARECQCGSQCTCGTGGRGPHACLCHWIADRQLPTPGTLCERSGYWFDPADGVALACVVVSPGPNRCDSLVIDRVEDQCSPRRLVKNNDLLYDLIRGCDLTHIAAISSDPWHRKPEPVDWKDFAEKFGDEGHTEFVVTFSSPVQTDSIRNDTVVMSVITSEQSTGWHVYRRIPISRVKPEDTNGDWSKSLRVIVSRKWIRDEIEKGESWLTVRDFTVEIEVRGDLILDCHGQPVDANSVGVRATPSGNGTPGGTFVSTFRVKAKPTDPSSDYVA